MEIINIINSPLKNKRFRVFLNNGHHYDFGLRDGSTYIDHKDEIKRDNYLKRHLGNKREYNLINNLVPSPSLYSAYILWGPYTSINENIDYLNSLYKY